MEHLVLRAGANDVGVPLLAEREHPVVVGPGGRGEAGAAARRHALAAIDRLARLRVVRLEEAAVQQAVVDALVDQRRGVVVAGLRLVPGDELALRCVALQRDVAQRARTDGEDRPALVLEVAGVDVDHVVRRERRGDGRPGHPSVHLPQQLAVQAVRADAVLAVGDDLGAGLVLPDERRGPARHLFAAGAPEFLAGSLVEGRDPGLLLVVVEDDQQIVVQHRRGGGAVVPHRRAIRSVEAPHRLAFHREGVHPEVAEARVHPLAVGGGRLGGVGLLLVAGELGNAGLDRPLPQHFAGRRVQAVDAPVVPRLRRFAAPAGRVEPGLGALEVAVGYRGGQEHPVAPGDRTGPAESGDLGYPVDVLRLAPAVRQGGVVGDGRVHVRAAELGPVVGRGGRGGAEDGAGDGREAGGAEGVVAVLGRRRLVHRDRTSRSGQGVGGLWIGAHRIPCRGGRGRAAAAVIPVRRRGRRGAARRRGPARGSGRLAG